MRVGRLRPPRCLLRLSREGLGLLRQSALALRGLHCRRLLVERDARVGLVGLLLLILVDLYVGRRDNDALYRVAESMIEVDEWCQAWRVRHYRVVARVIGDGVVGTQGTPVEVLGNLVHKSRYPELWRARNELTALSQAED